MLVAFFPGFINPILPTLPDHKRCGQREVPRLTSCYKGCFLCWTKTPVAFLGCLFLGKKSGPSSSEVDIVVSYPIDLLMSQVVVDSG